MKIKALLSFAVLAVAGALFISSCKKDEHVPPEMSFKTGANYRSTSDTATRNFTYTVGVSVKKKEDELRTLNVSYSYDGGASTTQQNITLSKSEEDGFDKDIQITTRNQAGTEKWSFTVTDKDGNIATKDLTFTVQ